MAGLSEESVSDYLSNNLLFVEKWLLSKAPNGFVKNVQEKALTDAEPSKPPDSPKLGSPWKVARNSITTNMFKRYVEGEMERRKTVHIRDRLSTRQLNEKELFMELIRDISSELDVNVLCHKILQNVMFLTNSDRGSLFLTRGTKKCKYLVSKLFDVTETSTLEESVHTESNEIKVPFGKGIAGLVAETQVPVNIKDAYEDPRFNKEVDKRTGYRTRSILCMAIRNHDGETVGVAQIINKLSANQVYSAHDEEVFHQYLTFCGIGITNAQLFELSVQEYKRNQLLLNLARGIFHEQTNLEKLVQKIMLDAQDLLKCERCSVYLVEDVAIGPSINVGSDIEDESLKKHKPSSIQDVTFSKAFDLYAKDEGNIHTPSAAELSKSKMAEIAKHVVLTGNMVNIADFEVDTRFGKGPFIDENGFKCASLLCTPVYDRDKQIIAISQQINKLNNIAFNESDESIIEAFSIFTGLGIHNCQMYEAATKLMAKQKVALEVLSYHATASPDEAEKLASAELPSAEELQLYTWDFNDLVLDEDGTTKAVMKMFVEANLINTFRIKYDVICRWTLSVKKNYRPVIYHNWRHAFNVAQTMFTMLYTGKMEEYFTDKDIFALLVACLCHDLDHRGTNNAFQVKSESPLATLYSTSVMEHHHFDHCIMILNSEGNNIFASLSSEEYRDIIKCLEYAILSTDLALYFRKRGDFKKVVENEADFHSTYQNDLLKAMMMTACDVAAITKPWELQRQVAELVSSEFFEQGDIEREKLGEEPMAMMDRKKKDELPKMQVGFIDAICLPVYQILADSWNGLKPLYEGCKNNRDNWQLLADESKAAEENAKDLNSESTKKPETGTEKPVEKNGKIPSEKKKPSLNNYKPTVGPAAPPRKSSLMSASRKESVVQMRKKKVTIIETPKKSKLCTIL